MSTVNGAADAALSFAGAGGKVRTLDNGIELLICEDHAAPVVSLQAWCRAGSIHEGDWLGGGLSHFLEHMLFKGTHRRDGNQIAQEVQAAGGYINAYTSFDRTVYWIDAPSTGFEACLDVLCDTVSNAALPADDFDKEQDVIRREFAMGDDQPESVLGKRLLETAFALHPCRHPVIGHLDLFNQLTRDDLADYYHRQYTPDNIFMVVAGDVDADRVEELVAEQFKDFRRRRRVHAREPDPEPRQLGRRERHDSFATEVSRLRMAWRVPGVTDPDLAALDVLATLLGHGRSSRLYRRLREELELMRTVGAFAYTPASDGLFIISGEMEPEQREPAQEAILKCIADLVADGVFEDELAKASRKTLSAVFHSLTTARGIASDLATNWLLTRNLDFTHYYTEAISAVTVDQVREVAARYLIDDSLTIVSLNPESKPSGPAILSESRTGGKVHREVLDNGLTLLVQEDRRTPLVTAHGTFRGGLLAETSADNGITQLLARLLAKDSAVRSAEEVAAAIESVGGGLSAGGGSNSLGATVGFMRPDFDLGIEILADALLEPKFVADTVDREKTFQIAAIKSEDDRPMSVAMRRLRSELFGSHPYGLRGSGSEQSVNGLSVEALQAFRQRIVTGKNGVVAVCGDVDAAQVIDAVGAKFGSMSSGQRLFTTPSAAAGDLFRAAEPRIVTDLHDKSQAILLVGFPISALDAPDQVMLELLDEACSDMASRLFIRIREEMGLAYSVGASRLIGLEPGCFIFYAATAPESLDEVQAALLEEIDGIATRGLEPAELERARASCIGKDTINLQSAGQLAGTMAVSELLGLGWDHHLKAPTEITAATAEQIQQVAKATFAEQSPMIVRLTTDGATVSES